MSLKPLTIGNLTAHYPIVQGGMGVGISLSSLAGAVAKEGGVGVISAAQPGFLENDFSVNPLEANLRALGRHIKIAKEIAQGGIIGVNIMRAAKNYEKYVQCCIENGADLIISGAGLPIELPQLVQGSNIKIAPIVSPLKACQVIFKMWDRRYHRMPDLVVIEGPKAGGHLGYSPQYLAKQEFDAYEKEALAILEYVKDFEKKYEKEIPVLFAGGVFDRKDMDHFLSLGFDGVQMATRFVATKECDADENFKKAYINAKKEDIVIVQSPVGLPGRAIENAFIRERKISREEVGHCYSCLEKCDPKTTPYCITSALVRSAKGDIENSLLFCGENAYKVNKMSTVKEIMQELTQ